mgnify:CR=1 FL=1
MFLLATNKRDITTDFIVLELERRGLPFLRLNTEELAGARIRLRPQGLRFWEFEVDGTVFNLDAVQAGYYRRPQSPLPPSATLSPLVQSYCVDEWSAVLRSLWNALEGKWLNSPFAILRAEDKPRQLREALALGFDVPDTLISNDFECASAFVDEAPSIGKPLRRALVEQGGHGEVLFTSRISGLQHGDAEAVAIAPVIYQREVVKACDVRVTVVGDRIFATAIHSQSTDETSVDWRKGARPDLAHEAIELPDSVQRLCLSLTRRLDLSFGAIDLVLDTAGRYWFLEINPNGQWAWIERRTGMPIASAIVDCLVEKGL